jgi:hypothetical protein
MGTSDSAPPAGISRRRVIQGVAWAAPAVVIATSAPAFANGSGTVPPSVASVGLSTTLSGGTTLSRVDNGSQYAIKTISVVVRVNKTVANGANYNDVTASVSSGSWTVAINQNGAGDPQPKHSSYAFVTFTYTGPALNNAEPAPIGWSIGGASLAGAQVSGTYGLDPGATVGPFGPIIIFGTV